MEKLGQISVCLQCFLIAVLLAFAPLTHAQDVTSGHFGDAVTLAALLIGVVALVGVVFLAGLLVFLVSRHRQSKKQAVEEVEMVYKSAQANAQKADVAHHVVNESSKIPRQGRVTVGVGTLRQVALTLLQDLLLSLYNVSVRRPHAAHAQAQPTPTPVQRKDSAQHLVPTSGADEVERQLQRGLARVFPGDGPRRDTFLALGHAVMAAATVRQLADAAYRTMRLVTGVVREWGVADQDYVGLVPTDGQGHIRVSVEDEVNALEVRWEADKFCPDLLTSVSMVTQALRDERRQPTPDEYIAMQLAYHLISQGQQMTHSQVRPLGSPGFRPHVQTQVALTDPGYGHVLGTTRRQEWMQGVVVHVQHLGGLEADTDVAPSLFDLGKVRLHVGEAAPTTFFLPRPSAMLTPHPGPVTSHPTHATSRAWEAELARLVQLTASSASAAFYQGCAACHVSMAGLSTAQAAAFMSQLRPNVHRDRHVQALSAVWDLAAPLTDDWQVEEGAAPATPTAKVTKVITDPYHVARRAVEVTLVGGFDQVTLFSSCQMDDDDSGPEKDDTSSEEQSSASSSMSSAKPEIVVTDADSPPVPAATSSLVPPRRVSGEQCALRQLTATQVLALTHLAHSRGLLVSFTGGVACPDLAPAALAGVDGVGVGGPGLLHHAGRGPGGQYGPLLEENIPEVLHCRNKAASTPRGRAAALLARLDTMFFEGSLASAENALRVQLYNALVDDDLAVAASVCDKLQDVAQLPAEMGHPLLGAARRLASRKAPQLKDGADSAYEWAMFVTRLRALVAKGEVQAVVEEHGGEPWRTYRHKYRQTREGSHGYFRQVSFQVALKTDF